jgi:hypothetical protein
LRSPAPQRDESEYKKAQQVLPGFIFPQSHRRNSGSEEGGKKKGKSRKHCKHCLKYHKGICDGRNGCVLCGAIDHVASTCKNNPTSHAKFSETHPEVIPQQGGDQSDSDVASR